MSNIKFKIALAKCKTVKEFFDVCEKFYDLKNAKLGVGAKVILTSQIDGIIAATGAKLK